MSKDVVLRIKINDTNGVKTIGDINAAATTTLTTINELEDAARLLNEELANTDRSTQRFQELSQQLRVVNTELRNQDLALEALDNEQFASELKSVTGGLMDMVGGLQLIGVSGGSLEEIAQTFAKVEGASRIAAGAIEMYSSGMKIANNLIVRATAASAAQTAATTAQGNASVFAATKMRILNAVMNANPAFLLITGLSAAAGALYLFSQAGADAEKQVDKLNSALDRADKEYEAFSTNIEGYNSKLINSLKLRGATDEEIALAEKQARDESLKAEREYLATRQNTLFRLMQIEGIASEDRIKYQEEFDKNIIRMTQITDDALIMSEQEYQLQLKDIRDKAAEEEKKRREENLKQIKQYIKEAQDLDKTDKEREIDDETKKYEDLRKLAGNNQSLLLELEISFNNKLIAIYDKYDKSADKYKQTLFDVSKALEEAKEKQDEYNASLGENAIEELDKVEEAKQKRIELEREYNLLLGEERGKARTAQFEQLEKDLKNELDNIELSEAEKQVIYERYEQNRRNLIKETNELIVQDLNTISASFNEAISGNFSSAADSIRDMAAAVNSLYDSLNLIIKSFENGTFEEIANNITSMAAALTDITTDLIGSIANKQFEEDNKLRENLFNEEQEKYQDMLANRLISQEEYDSKVRNLEQQKRESERKARQDLFASEKKLGIADAIMNTAQAVTSALATGGPIAGPILAGVVGGLGAVQIGIIKGQEFTAARGGIVPDNGKPSNIDSVSALLAPGETVINSKSSSMFGELLNMINVAGGGVPLLPENISNNTQKSNIDNQQFSFNIKANVLESDMTRVQKNVNKMRNSGRLY